MGTEKRIYRTKNELDERGKIPINYHDILEHRMVIACGPLFKDRRHGPKQRTMEDIRSTSNKRKAQKVYLDILDEDPNIFLPFILQVSEYTCISFNVSQFCQHHQKETPIRLSIEAKNLLDDIATRRNLLQAPSYKKLVDFFFPRPKPVTTADSDKHWAYSAASLRAIQNFFGDGIYNLIQYGPIRMQEKTPLTTECVRMKLPTKDSQDAFLILDVKLDKVLISDLFPRLSDKLFSLLQEHPSDSHMGSSAVNARPECLDNAYFNLHGASIAGVTSKFCLSICQAIEKNQLRKWEKDNMLHDTTDSVTMQVYRTQPHHGTIHLRLSFLESIDILKDLFVPDV